MENKSVQDKVSGGLFKLIESTSQKKAGGPFARIFARDKLDFSRQEIKRIHKAVGEQLSSPGPFIEINGISLPRAGHIFKIKGGTRYTFFAPGTPVLVVCTFVNKVLLTDPGFEPEVSVMALNSEGSIVENRDYLVRVGDIEPVSEGELMIFLENRRRPVLDEDVFHDGEAVELSEDYTEKMESARGASSRTFPKGLSGVVDSPGLRVAASLDDINSPHQRHNKILIKTGIILVKMHRQEELEINTLEVPLEKRGQKYSVYFPIHQRNIQLHYSQIRRRSFDKDMFSSKVILDDKTRESILSLVSGDEEVLSKWGMRSFQKGRGKIFLAFGPSGTGKTLTGEALAELLGRPLFVADSTTLVPVPGHFERALQDVIEKTERWNSVTVIDEAEGILLSRDASFHDASWRIEAVLRNLEKLEKGILWLTTNRPIDIDPAINSRIRSQIYFPALDIDKRRKVWQCTFPKSLPVEDMTDSVLDELAGIEINGREIKNAILNAADRASYDKLSYVPAEYFLAAAKMIRNTQDILEAAKKKHYNHRGRDRIGFLR